jgi:hypothetical protein
MRITRAGLPLIIIEPCVVATLFGLGFCAITDRVGRIFIIIVVEFIIEASVVLIVVAITDRGTIGFTLTRLNCCLAQQGLKGLNFSW